MCFNINHILLNFKGIIKFTDLAPNLYFNKICKKTNYKC